ncbi:MAG: hypothetical protein ACP5HQ_02255 [Thermoprotei archaeon]
MTYQGADAVEKLRISLTKIRQGKPEAVREFLLAVSSLMPPSTDFGIQIGKRGKQEYYVDHKGFSVILLSEDEYLPYLSSKEIRVEPDKVPEDVLKQARQDYKRILRELLDSLMEYAKRHKEYYKLVEEVNGVVLQNL